MVLSSRHFMFAAGLLALGQAACGESTERGDEARAGGLASGRFEQAAACEFGGTWAFKFVIPVAWSGNAGVQGGSGEIIQWARAERTHQDNTLSDDIVACGSTVPDYKSQALWGGETFGTRFPDALFDSGKLSATTLASHLSGSVPGDTYASDVMAVQLGVAMADPLHDPWPKATQDLLALSVDSDGDGKPGISLETATGPGMSRPPVSYSRRRRATQFFVAVRDLTASKGTIVSCDRFEGTADIPEMGGVPALHSRVLGCTIEDGSECSNGELTLANMFQPPYRLAGEAKAVLVRVPTNTSCATIRAMDF
jgi:hypothetical protein